MDKEGEGEQVQQKREARGVHDVCWNREKILAFVLWLNILCNVFVRRE